MEEASRLFVLREQRRDAAATFGRKRLRREGNETELFAVVVAFLRGRNWGLVGTRPSRWLVLYVRGFPSAVGRGSIGLAKVDDVFRI